jgi:CRP-like cAMP-binding protein
LGAIEILKRSEAFLGLSDDDLQKVVDLPSCHEKRYQTWEVIFAAGEEARHLYVLEEGQVDLSLKRPVASAQLREQTVVSIVTKGGVFGWPALVPPHVFGMSAISKGPSKVLVMGAVELRALLDKHPHIGYEVTKSLLRVILSRFSNIEQMLITGTRSPWIGKPKKSSE